MTLPFRNTCEMLSSTPSYEIADAKPRGRDRFERRDHAPQPAALSPASPAKPYVASNSSQVVSTNGNVSAARPRA